MDETAPQILVLGRDVETRREIEPTLRDAGLHASYFDDAAHLLAFLETSRPSIMLLELDTHSEHGLELVRKLRERPRTKDVSIIVIGSPADDDQITRAVESGADDLIHKPIRSTELIARIRAQLRARRYVDELERKERDAQVMLELTRALASSLDLREILYTVVRRIAEVVEFDRVSIVLAPAPDEGTTGYVTVASDDEGLSNLQLDLAKYPEIQQVLRTCEPLTIRDASKHPVLDGVRADVKNVRLSAMTLVPIVWESTAVGVLYLRARPERGPLSERELHFCRIVANATGAALRNVSAVQSMRDHTQKVMSARADAEQRLESLKRYADLFASAADGIAVIDSTGKLLFANPRAYEITGHTEESLRGKKMLELVPEDVGAARVLWAGFATNEYARDVDLKVVRASGDTIVCNCSFAPLLQSEGAVLLSFRDVTEERHTEAELLRTKEFLESLIEASVDGIVAADTKGTIILFNQGAERIYGYRSEEVVGKMHVDRLYPKEGARRVMSLLRSPQHGGRGRLENLRMDALDARGETIPIAISAAIIYEAGKPAATFGIFKDLREKLHVEERLAQAQQKLEVTEKQALIAELAGTAAHELNQPLTSVMGYAELLKRKLELDTSERNAADIIVQEAERMADIVRKIGKITKYETKSYVGQQNILDLDKASEEPGRLAGK